MDDLFRQEDQQRNDDCEKDLLKKIERDYKSLFTTTDEQVDRDREKKEIKNEISRLGSLIRKTKNTKSHRRTDTNSECAATRDRYRKEISVLEKRLYDIECEEMGVRTSLKNLHQRNDKPSPP